LRPRAGEVLVYKPEDAAPYRSDDLGGLDQFLEAVCSDSDENNISQSRLEQNLEEFGPQLGEPDRWCAFVAGSGYLRADESFRDIEEFTVPAVLESQIAEFQALERRRAPTAGLTVPVPRRCATQDDSRLPKYLAVAPDERYDPLTGFWDQLPAGGLL
jgi:CRISPR-associated endonuclease/helicase Cas3